MIKLSEQDGRQYHITLDCFNEIQSKNGAVTTRDLWSRQLMCVRGLSQFKVAQITQRFPTLQR